MYWTRGAAWAYALTAFASLGALVATWACDLERWWLWGYAGVSLGVVAAILLCFFFLRVPAYGDSAMGGAGQIIYTILTWLHVAFNVVFLLALYGVLGSTFRALHEGTCRNWLTAFPCINTAGLVLLFVIFVLDMQAASKTSLPSHTRLQTEGGGSTVVTPGENTTTKVRSAARAFNFAGVN